MPRFAWAPEDVAERLEDARGVKEAQFVSTSIARCPQTPPPRGRGPATAVTPQTRGTLRRERAVATPTCIAQDRLQPSSPWRRPQARPCGSRALPLQQSQPGLQQPPQRQPPQAQPPTQLQSQPRTQPQAQAQSAVALRGTRRSHCELPLRAPRGVPPEADPKAGQHRAPPAAAEARPSKEPPPLREDGLRAALQACESELQTERAGAAERANLLRAELAQAEQREGQLLEELERLRRKMHRERSRRKTAERDLERCRMEAEDARRSEAAACPRLARLCASPSTPSSSRSAGSLSDATAGVFGAGRGPSEQGGKAVRKNSFGLPLSPGTPPPKAPAARTTPSRSPSPAVMSQAESLVLEMFACEAPTTRSVVARSPPAPQRSPLSKARSPGAGSRSPLSKEPIPSPTSSARSEASAQTEPPGFPSFNMNLSLVPMPPSEGKKPMLLALNGRMPSFPSAELSGRKSKSSEKHRNSCPVFELSPKSGADSARGPSTWDETDSAVAASGQSESEILGGDWGGCSTDGPAVGDEGSDFGDSVVDCGASWTAGAGLAAGGAGGVGGGGTTHDGAAEGVGSCRVSGRVADGAGEGGQDDQCQLAGLASALAAAMGSSEPWLSPLLSPRGRGEELAAVAGAGARGQGWGRARGGGRTAEPEARGHAEVPPLWNPAEGLGEVPEFVRAGPFGRHSCGDLGRARRCSDAA
mmetsp:Transcript_61253/g.192858  ORF Transcript_61253/g.192858 Transcript_61253/m.192858 type:complete len:701 (-) Transcript_61253:71-2173(-)